jgi:hypothetical protein
MSAAYLLSSGQDRSDLSGRVSGVNASRSAITKKAGHLPALNGGKQVGCHRPV